jgi:hypothetical protein
VRNVLAASSARAAGCQRTAGAARRCSSGVALALERDAINVADHDGHGVAVAPGFANPARAQALHLGTCNGGGRAMGRVLD